MKSRRDDLREKLDQLSGDPGLQRIAVLTLKIELSVIFPSKMGLFRNGREWQLGPRRPTQFHKTKERRVFHRGNREGG